MHEHHHEHTNEIIEEQDRATCPVMHIGVSKTEAEAKGLTRKFEGKTYYLCCRSCETMFDDNPRQYVNSNRSAQ